MIIIRVSEKLEADTLICRRVGRPSISRFKMVITSLLCVPAIKFHGTFITTILFNLSHCLEQRWSFSLVDKEMRMQRRLVICSKSHSDCVMSGLGPEPRSGAENWPGRCKKILQAPEEKQGQQERQQTKIGI